MDISIPKMDVRIDAEMIMTATTASALKMPKESTNVSPPHVKTIQNAMEVNA